jgi:hypothetical protein
MIVAVRGRVMNVAVVLSLVACLTAGALWARSHRVLDMMGWTGEGAGAGVVASRGQVSIRLSTYRVRPPIRTGWHREVQPRPSRLAVPRGASTRTLGQGADTYTSREWGAAGFGVRHNSNSNGTSVFLLVPHWFLVALGAIRPVIWTMRRYRRWRARRREDTGLCPRCGYDLRATPGRCPECGEAPTSAPALPV